jgi:hypothetical protein
VLARVSTPLPATDWPGRLTRLQARAAAGR